MSPFEFLEDLKRDRSSSLETLHHMLRCAITGIILLARSITGIILLALLCD
jgi:hypothetical protein